MCSNRKPNAGLNLTTGRRLLVPPQAAQHVWALRILSEMYICICTCTYSFWYVILLKSFSFLGNTCSTQNATSSSGLPSAVSSSGPPSTALPTLTSPNAGTCSRFLSVCCWFYSVFCWLFVVLLLLSKISWICVGCWHLSLCVFMCMSCTPSCYSLKLRQMVDQSEDHISHTLWSVFVRDGASHVISADRKRL